jgi:malonyl-CoA/methylmalonyl-CoA synthetase
MTAPLVDLAGPPPDRTAVRVGPRGLSYQELAHEAAGVAAALRGHDRVAVLATSSVETCVAVVAAVAAGVAAVPLNPGAGPAELDHIVRDSRPSLLLRPAQAAVPDGLAGLPRFDVTVDGGGGAPLPSMWPEPDGDAPALVIYTSGTTGPPKGVVLPRRAVRATLDSLADAWQWTDRDVVTHALPLFHVHGLVLSVLGPLRRGGTVRHLGSFSPDALASAIGEEKDPVVVFGVPTMYHRLGKAAEEQPAVADGLARARLLVSGSAALARGDYDRIERHTGQRIVQRYGMTETLMICSVRADGDRRPDIVGPPLAGVAVRLVDDAGDPVGPGAIGEVEVRGENLFTGYLNRPEAFAQAQHDGWFRTGDAGILEPDGALRLIGRLSSDIIKSGGYKIGAGEIEEVIREHPAVVEVAVVGEPDIDLGERVVAWVVPAGGDVSEEDILVHATRLLAKHKRPRAVRFLAALPRNPMGKVVKSALH